MENLNEQVQDFITKYGRPGYRLAKREMLYDDSIKLPIKPVLKYFIEKCWPNMQHSALISLTCEAVGGKPETPIGVSAALILLTGAADMHDDIIDKSTKKGPVTTAYGKFGSETVIIAGDILILKALSKLNNACDDFSREIRKEIRLFVDNGFFELGAATAIERLYKGKSDISPSEYFKVFHGKGAVSEACSRIGALIGGGSPDQINLLGRFGRTLGTLMALRHEFEDMHSLAELKNRQKNEILPLPLLYALTNKNSNKEIVPLLRRLTRKNTETINRIALNSNEVISLIKDMREIISNCENNVLDKISKNRTQFRMLLRLSIEGL